MDKKKIWIILFLSFGIIGSYGFPYMKGTFYNIMKMALGLSDVQLGHIWSVFGIVGMASYIGGGYMTDRCSPHKIIEIALSISALLHLYVSFIPKYEIILLISALMGIATVFAFFPASSKILNFIGNDHHAGIVFGLYYALEGVGGMLVNTLGTRVYVVTENEFLTFSVVVRLFALLNLIGAIGIHFMFAKNERVILRGNRISFNQFRSVLVKKEVWLIAFITICNFWLYCSLTYVTPYLTEVFGVSHKMSLICGIIRVNVVALFAGLFFGKMSDKMRSAIKVINIIMPLQCLCIVFIILNQISVRQCLVAVILTMLIAFCATGVKVIGIVMISEFDFPLIMVGTIIGVVSFIGYSPDAFSYSVIGILLQNKGDEGYLYLFIISFIVAVLAGICGKKLYEMRKI